MIVGSLNLSKILAKAKEKHSAFSKAENGDLYFNLIVWENDEKDKYDNTHSFQLNSHKDKKEAEGKIYIGNAKPIERKEPVPLSQDDAKTFTEDLSDLPF